MDEFADMNGVVASLARLRTNAVLAMNTSGARAVSPADLEQLDAIVAGVFGETLDGVEVAPLGTVPKPEGTILNAIRERLPEDQADGAQQFLVDLHERVLGWFNT